MIRINLLGEPESEDNTAILWISGYAVSVLVLLIFCFYLSTSLDAEIQNVTFEQNSLQGQLDRLKETTKEVRELEAKKAELKEKLVIIALLKRNKVGPVRVMDSINVAMPARAWLLGLNERANLMRVSGMALDNQTITTLMKELENSEFFEAVDLVESKKSAWQGVEIQQFILQTKVRYAGNILQAEAAPAGQEQGLNGEQPATGGT